MFDDYAENQSHPSWLKASFRKPHFGKRKVLALAILVLIVTGGFLLSNLATASHEFTSALRLQPIFQDRTSNAADFAANWNSINATWSNAAGTGCDYTPGEKIFGGCIKLNPSNGGDPNTIRTALAISKKGFYLDSVLGHNLLIDGHPWADTLPGNNNTIVDWGFFLTRNNTIPLENRNQGFGSAWLPHRDANVALIVTFTDVLGLVPGTTDKGLIASVQIQSGDSATPVGSAFGYQTCKTDNSPKYPSQYICSRTNNWDHDNNGTNLATGFGQINEAILSLNMTGATHTTGNTGLSQLLFGSSSSGGCDDNAPCSFVLPPLQIQGTLYYFGYFMTLSQQPVYFATGGGVYRADIVTTNIDTGGFFGPLIRALVVIKDVFVTVFDTIGQALGLGSIGTIISTFFADVIAWFQNVLGPAFAALGNLAAMAGSALSFLAGFFLINPLLGFLSLLASAWGTINGGFTFLNMLMVSGGIGLSYFFLFNYIYGMFRLWKDGMDGFHKWLDLNFLVLFGLFKAGMFFSNQAIQMILQVKGIIFKWL